jgi:hypothetical protein
MQGGGSSMLQGSMILQGPTATMGGSVGYLGPANPQQQHQQFTVPPPLKQQQQQQSQQHHRRFRPEDAALHISVRLSCTIVLFLVPELRGSRRMSSNI